MTIALPPMVHGMPRAKALAHAAELLSAVGLEPALFQNRYRTSCPAASASA